MVSLSPKEREKPLCLQSKQEENRDIKINSKYKIYGIRSGNK